MRARLAELPLLVVLLGLTGLLALIPALHALSVDNHELARAFFYSGLLLLIVTVMIGIATALRMRPAIVSTTADETFSSTTTNSSPP